jgi:uncharacterized repeat protein (TIGR03803 family)
MECDLKLIIGRTIDSAGNLYGTTFNGGSDGMGTVFELSPPSSQGGGWTETVLWSFSNSSGNSPHGPLLMDSSGNLYGTTSGDSGTVFELSPVSGGSWAEQTLYVFGANNSEDGSSPVAGLTFDSSGNLYGTTVYGGTGTGLCRDQGCGTIFKLSPQSGAGWQETVLHSFTGTFILPESNLDIDQQGNLYGTVEGDGISNGGVFRFSPNTGMSIFRFDYQDGANPYAGLLIEHGTGYGVTWLGGANGKGTVFQIHGKQESVLYSFCSQANCADGDGPMGGGSLVSLRGKLYGTTSMGGTYNQGIVFEMTP